MAARTDEEEQSEALLEGRKTGRALLAELVAEHRARRFTSFDELREAVLRQSHAEFYAAEGIEFRVIAPTEQPWFDREIKSLRAERKAATLYGELREIVMTKLAAFYNESEKNIGGTRTILLRDYVRLNPNLFALPDVENMSRDIATWRTSNAPGNLARPLLVEQHGVTRPPLAIRTRTNRELATLSMLLGVGLSEEERPRLEGYCRNGPPARKNVPRKKGVTTSEVFQEETKRIEANRKGS